MDMKVKFVNRLFMMTTAPFLGLMLWMVFSSLTVSVELTNAKPAEINTWNTAYEHVTEGLDQAGKTAQYTIDAVRRVSVLYKQTTSTMNDIVYTASKQANRPETIYNKRISSKLGAPIDHIESDNIRAELYAINQATYNGYAMKVKLKEQKAMKMTLGKDKYGGSETTMQAVKRYGAVAGINAGGYAEGRGNRYPLGTTVLNGDYVSAFEPSFKDLAFVGLDTLGRLIGGKFFDKTQLDQKNPKFGATFVPHLLNNGNKLTIPDKWKAPNRAPRTTIGNYKDDQLLIMVIDGYNENGGSGATLEEMQQKMINLGVRDAYNLDGGGSSSLIFKGRVVNHPSDGELRQLPTHFLFFE
ncbi:phosphodiester glycosidase family protein [Paenibacillus sp. UMB4589-SE434]|uniref:phosphodiester glycosidase family protein n=1 Tax=Paenibacillus sp. UMB4589-SE434 TaxID=3046314 RepID=UPI0025516029|nr:phosphodiester glycosidase family protein [Paenibacillus sp. UMB4589-SE434]MDK8183129.1 phosphodiester glycosidase family protein [Paenibacillus sp. UMB4589-SE434]